jgi:hypothetical protein
VVVRPVALVSCLVLAGCWGNVATEYPPGLEPLEDNTAPDPGGLDQLSILPGNMNGYAYAHGRGWVSAPAAAVWLAIQDPEVVVSWRHTTSHMATVTPDPAYELRFTMHYFVDEIVNVEWDEDWRYGTITGMPGTPELAMTRYQKVFGTTFIDLIEGSIQVIAKDPSTTEVQFVEHVDAAQGGTSDITDTFTDRFAAIVARVHGQPLPPR